MVTHADDGQSLLGGISSQFRINPYTGQHLEVRRASGATIETTDGGRYLDMFMAHGSTVLGHAHPDVVRAIREILEFGVVIGYETGLGEEVAHRLTRSCPPPSGCASSPPGARRSPPPSGSAVPIPAAKSS